MMIQQIKNGDTRDKEQRYKRYRMEIEGMQNGDQRDKEWRYKG